MYAQGVVATGLSQAGIWNCGMKRGERGERGEREERGERAVRGDK